jgi:hypothetical protein
MKKSKKKLRNVGRGPRGISMMLPSLKGFACELFLMFVKLI